MQSIRCLILILFDNGYYIKILFFDIIFVGSLISVALIPLTQPLFYLQFAPDMMLIFSQEDKYV